VVSLKPRPLYTRGKIHWSASNRSLGWPQSRSGCFGENKNFLSLPGIEPLCAYVLCKVVRSFCVTFAYKQVVFSIVSELVKKNNMQN
jgi:hypothetical protein